MLAVLQQHALSTTLNHWQLAHMVSVYRKELHTCDFTYTKQAGLSRRLCRVQRKSPSPTASASSVARRRAHVGREEGVRLAGRARAPGAADAVHVVLHAVGKVVVDHGDHVGHVQAARRNVRRAPARPTGFFTAPVSRLGQHGSGAWLSTRQRQRADRLRRHASHGPQRAGASILLAHP
jgi:hypothetical protein